MTAVVVAFLVARIFHAGVIAYVRWGLDDQTEEAWDDRRA